MSSVEGSLQDALSLWRTYAEARKQLQARRLCRSCKDPEADFAEWLVAHVLRGELAENRSHPTYDVEAGDLRVQVRKYGKGPDNHAPMATYLQSDPNRRPTHYAFVDYQEGIPKAIYVCTYEWVARNANSSGGLPIKRVREAARRQDQGVTTYTLEEPDQVYREELPGGARGTDEDPLVRLLGSVRSPVAGVSERHDEFLGRGLVAELHDEDDARSPR